MLRDRGTGLRQIHARRGRTRIDRVSAVAVVHEQLLFGRGQPVEHLDGCVVRVLGRAVGSYAVGLRHTQ